MNLDKHFPLQVAVVLAVGIAGAALLLPAGENLVAVVVGGVLSAINVGAGFLAIEYSLEKSHATFLKVVLGGMGIRMGLMLGILALLMKFSTLPTIPLVVAMLGFYSVYLVLEILYIQRKVSHQIQDRR